MWLHCLNDTTLAFFNYYSAFDATRTQRFTSLPVGSVHRHTSHAPAPAPRARTRTRRGRGRGGTKSKDTEHLPLRSSLSGGGGTEVPKQAAPLGFATPPSHRNNLEKRRTGKKKQKKTKKQNKMGKKDCRCFTRQRPPTPTEPLVTRTVGSDDEKRDRRPPRKRVAVRILLAPNFPGEIRPGEGTRQSNREVISSSRPVSQKEKNNTSHNVCLSV